MTPSTANLPELLPCPFCGCIDPMMSGSHNERWFDVCCVTCQAHSDLCMSREEAAGKWNRRADRARRTSEDALVLQAAIDEIETAWAGNSIPPGQPREWMAAGKCASVECIRDMIAARKEQPMAELKPCPFCGGPNVEVHEGDTFRWRYAACANCGARAPEARIQTLGEGTQDEWEAQARVDAFSEWNLRAAPPAPVESAWISVHARLPEDYRQACVVAWRPYKLPGWGYAIATLSSPHQGRMLWHGQPCAHNDVTHWMPLPAPPVASETPPAAKDEP